MSSSSSSISTMSLVEFNTMEEQVGLSALSRSLTPKDYGDKIKQLQHENFQLKVRIFLSEQKNGAKFSNSDLPETLKQYINELHNANPIMPNDSKKHYKELETNLQICEKALEEKRLENEKLVKQKENLQKKVEDLELALNMRDNQDLEDRSANIAFGDFDYDHKEEMEGRLKEQMKELDKLRRKIGKYKYVMGKLEKVAMREKAEKAELQDKVMEFTRVLLEMEKRNESQQMHLRSRIESLQAHLQMAFGRIQELEYGALYTAHTREKMLVNRGIECPLRILKVGKGSGPSAQSPDLGIDSGDGVNSDDSHGGSDAIFEIENCNLRKANQELAAKLRQTRQVLQNTLEKLYSTTKQKEQLDKAVCRQLHKTHTIIRQAKKSVQLSIKSTSPEINVKTVDCKC